MIIDLALCIIILVAMIIADNIYIEIRQPDFLDQEVKQDFYTNIHLQDYPSLAECAHKSYAVRAPPV